MCDCSKKIVIAIQNIFILDRYFQECMVSAVNMHKRFQHHLNRVSNSLSKIKQVCGRTAQSLDYIYSIFFEFSRGGSVIYSTHPFKSKNISQKWYSRETKLLVFFS